MFTQGIYSRQLPSVLHAVKMLEKGFVLSFFVIELFFLVSSNHYLSYHVCNLKLSRSLQFFRHTILFTSAPVLCWSACVVRRFRIIFFLRQPLDTDADSDAGFSAVQANAVMLKRH